jgi:outer membrane protein assembly factor BamB
MIDSFPHVRAVWTLSCDANVVSTPAVTKDLVVFGNSKGRVDALSLKDGKRKWTFATGGSIYSSPAVDGGLIVLGSGDGSVYALSLKDGRQVWRLQTGAAVLGSPVIRDGVVYIGGSDDRFRAVELKSGKELWAFAGLDGPVVGKPLVLADRVVFGAWDRHLYAVDRKEGRLLWKWNNGSPIRNYSPASCTPVVRDGVVYVVAPDRYLSAIDMETGATLWRTNESTVRESIGISSDGSLVYGKTMMDTVVAFPTSRTKQASAWKLPAGFGYEHTPSMLVEKGGLVHFGTRSGVVYAIDPANRRVAWKHKIDNSMVNTVNAFEERRLVAATMDGKVALLERLR